MGGAETPREQALPLLPGESPRKPILLPNQWRLDPAGESRPLGLQPLNMRLSPDGKYLAVLHSGTRDQEIMVFETEEARLVSRTALPNTFYGLVFSKDGSQLYVSGGEDEWVYRFAFAKGYLYAPETISLATPEEQKIPCGLALSADGLYLAVAELWGDAVVIIHLPSGGVVATIPLERGSFPYDCKFSPDGKTLYVSLWGKASIRFFDFSVPAEVFRKNTVSTGDHPNEMVPSGDGSRLFTANANVNTVSVIDTASGRVEETLNTAMHPGSPEGSTPNSLALSPNGEVLYVANADNNDIAVFDVSEKGESRSLGMIPVGWYPTSVRLSNDGKTIYVANAKGFSSSANPHGPNPYWRNEDDNRRTDEQHIQNLLTGTLSIIPTPLRGEYPGLSARVFATSPYREDKRPVAVPGRDNPVPAEVGMPSPIKYCIYIIKENRTYDQVLGDMPEGNGDPALCLFPERATPNHHALAREFVLLDNFYADAEVSADGHEWSTGAYATDFVEKIWPGDYGDHGFDYPSEGRYAIASPSAGYIWDRCREAGVSYRSYGEFVEAPEEKDEPGQTFLEALQGHFDPNYRGWDLDYLDVDRAKRFIGEFKEFIKRGTLPRFIIMRLPNDHTSGTEEGSFTPGSMVADNDLALGMVVETVSKSPLWKETAIFIIEDDAQNGPDHVDAHRTIAFAVSPYTRGRGKDSTFYSTSSMLRTMELILGLEPMSQYDTGARPMYNAFHSKPDLQPFRRRPVPRRMRSRKNSPQAWGVELSANLNFEKEDAADDFLFNEIIWRSVKGGDAPMPAPVRSTVFHAVQLARGVSP